MNRRMGAQLRFGSALLLVAGCSAAFAIAFRLSLGWLYAAAYGDGNVVQGLARLSPLTRVLVVLAGVAVAGTIVRLSAARSQGVGNVMEAVVLGRVQLSLRATAARISASWAAIAGGLSIGREGPLIEFGGALGQRWGVFRTSKDQLRILVAVGTAAGFAAAYNTPFAAIIFVLETIVGVAAPSLSVRSRASEARPRLGAHDRRTPLEGFVEGPVNPAPVTTACR